MADQQARTFRSDFRRFFLRGLVVLLPSVLTLWIVVKAYQFVDGAIAEPINGGVRLAMAKLAPYWGPLREQFNPEEDELAAARGAVGARAPSDHVLVARMRTENIERWWADRWYLDLIGLAVAIVAVYMIGRLVGGYIGPRVYRKIERVITSLPVFKQVYPYVKQIVDFLFSEEKQITFNRVVMVQYPRHGIWSIGFQTGGGMSAVLEQSGDAASVFIPSSPTPFTGYTITVPRKDLLEIPITVEEAIRFVVSGGVLVPEHQICRAESEAPPELRKRIRAAMVEAETETALGPAADGRSAAVGGAELADLGPAERRAQ